MNRKEILKKVDHTILNVDTKEEEIKTLIDDGIKYGVASVCVPPSFVKIAKTYSKGLIKICTVISFPNGYQTTETKLFETENAIKNGASEIDVVINISKVKSCDYEYIENEIKLINELCHLNGAILKVIVETALLTEEELIKMCFILSSLKVDFIKTSTGFSKRGASFKDIKIIKKNIFNDIKIKASGGISSFEDAEKFIELGASRLGTSRLIKILKEKE